MSRVQAKLIVFLNLSQPIFNLHGHGDGALQVLVAGLWQGLWCFIRKIIASSFILATQFYLDVANSLVTE